MKVEPLFLPLNLKLLMIKCLITGNTMANLRMCIDLNENYRHELEHVLAEIFHNG